MKKEKLRDIIEKTFVPLFSGSELQKEESESNTRESEVSLGGGGRFLLIKTNRSDNFRLKLFREQKFKNDDKEIAKAIIKELQGYGDIPDKYKDDILLLYVENAIAEFLASKKEYSPIIIQIIRELRKWSGRMYEGRDVSFGIELDLTDEPVEDKENFLNNLGQDFFALVSDGIDTKIKFNRTGELLDITECKEANSDLPRVPYRFVRFASSLAKDNIGFILLRNKEILIIKNEELLFAYRRGAWRYFQHEAIITRMAAGSRYTSEKIREAIYSTCLDVSFARFGGSITYLRKTREKHCQENLLTEKDIIATSKTPKAKVIMQATNDSPFHKIQRKIRQELVGIDGATVLKSDGTLLTCGAIIKIEQGSADGGRSASVKTLADYGVSIKISADGEIECYSKDSSSTKSESDDNNVKLMFSIG